MFDFNFIKKSIDGLTTEFKKVRDEIESKKQRMEYLQCSPACKEDILSMLYSYVDNEASLFPKKIHNVIQMIMRKPLGIGQYSKPGCTQHLPVLHVSERQDALASSADIQSNMFFLLKDQIKEGLGKAVELMEWPESGPLLVERLKEIEVLSIEISKLEAVEADIYQKAENAGVHIERVKSVGRSHGERFGGGVPLNPANTPKL